MTAPIFFNGFIYLFFQNKLDASHSFIHICCSPNTAVYFQTSSSSAKQHEELTINPKYFLPLNNIKFHASVFCLFSHVFKTLCSSGVCFLMHTSPSVLFEIFDIIDVQVNLKLSQSKCWDVLRNVHVYIRGKGKKRQNKREKRESDGKRRHLGFINGNLPRPSALLAEAIYICYRDIRGWSSC